MTARSSPFRAALLAMQLRAMTLEALDLWHCLRVPAIYFVLRRHAACRDVRHVRRARRSSSRGARRGQWNEDA